MSGRVVLALLLLSCGAARAVSIEEARQRLKLPETSAVKPGDVVTAKDAEKIKNLVSPGVHWLVEHGMQMNIIEHTRLEEPPAYHAATEKYSAQVKLTPDGVLDENTYVAGRPFPLIDMNDPMAAIKIM